MKCAEKGDIVNIKIEATLENGEQCFQNDKDNSIEFTVGEGKLFPVLENNIINMKEGETKEVILQPKDAFGLHLKELIMEAPITAFRPNTNLSIGMKIKIDAPSGKVYYGTLLSINDDTITLDLNHPLAGQKIKFTITLIAITEKTVTKNN